ncbi:MAG: GntR family transcriptional regulator [Candidatus Rifleibacteriota bacterium]
MLNLIVDSTSKKPAYLQISDYAEDLIKNGGLHPGQQLPPERELAMFLGLARGTVKKAYEILARKKLIVATRGRGSIVSGSVSEIPGSRLETAHQKIRSLLLELEDLHFSAREIHELFSLCVSQREEELARFSIAAVDCNPEALAIYRQQIAVLTRMSLALFDLEELRREKSPETVLQSFAIILTTSTHIDELRKLVPSLEEKCVPVMVAPSPATLMTIARIASDQKVGVLYKSPRFFEIIGDWLKKSGFSGDLQGFPASDLKDEIFEKNLEKTDVLIVPPGFAAQFSLGCLKEISRFRQNGGTMIDFAYEIERGSLLHLEGLIKSLFNQTRNQL